VAEQKTNNRQLGATPGKLALIGVLAVMLVAALYVQFAPSGEDVPEIGATSPAPAKQRPSASRPAASEAEKGNAEAKSQEWLIETVDRRQWKSPPLADVARYDPFALPAAFPQPVSSADIGPGSPEDGVISADATMSEDLRAQTIADVEEKLAELKQRGVRVIIQGRNRAAAVIGDRTVHVGDVVDGFTVKAIKAEGVVVERKLD
jgi:hypothetical protein